MANSFLNNFGGGFNLGEGIAQRNADAQRQSRLGELASQAHGAPESQRNALVQQAIQNDPNSGFALERSLQATDEQRQKGLVNAAKMLISAPAQYRNGMYQRMRPGLERRYGMTGLPADYDQTVDQMAEQLAALDGTSDNTPADIRSLQMLSKNPELAALDRERRQASGMVPKLIETASGYMWGTPGGAAAPVREAGNALSQGMQQVQYATDDGSQIPPEEQAAVQAAFAADARGEQFDFPVTAGGPPAFRGGIVQPRSAAQDNPIVTLNSDEVAALGLPAGTVAQRDMAGRVSIVSSPKEASSSKPMPVGALRMIQDAREGLSVAQGLNQSLSSIQGQLASGQINLGPIRNWISRGRNTAGMSTEESRNFQVMMSSLEKLRNDTLRLNKGVQTEGDAQRAWNELLANVNDEKAVAVQIDRLLDINRRAERLQQDNMEAVQANYGQGGQAVQGPPQGGYQPGQIIEANGKRYRVTGGDPTDPDVEEVH